MRPELAAHAATQSGLVTRAQAKQAGYTERELRTLTKPGGEWHVVRRGVYVLRVTWLAADSRGRHFHEVLAARLNARHPVVASHGSAAVLQGLSVLHVPRLVHVTRTAVNGGRTEHGVKYHPARIPPQDVLALHGLLVTAAARTAMVVAREEGHLPGLVVADQVLRGGAAPDDLARVVRGMKSWPGVTRARAASHDADGRSESVGETLARAAVTELGLGRPEPQHEVSDGRSTARADLRLGWHLFEFDGRVKYARLRPYADDRPGEDVLWAEKRREDWLRSLGYGVSRVVWGELFGPARERTLHRLRADVEVTRRRVGESAWRISIEETTAAAYLRGAVDAPHAS
jgi:hypothetical protein